MEKSVGTNPRQPVTAREASVCLNRPGQRLVIYFLPACESVKADFFELVRGFPAFG